MEKKYRISKKEELIKLLEEKKKEHGFGEANYVDLRGTKFELPFDFDLPRLERLAKLLRGIIFATVEAGQSGHPGGSSSKVEQLLALLFSHVLAFDPLNPKHPGRDRLIWSAGHCTPLLHSALSLIYESLRREGRQFSEAVVRPVFPEDLGKFRRVDGPQGHVESYLPLADYSTGPSGHGFSAAGGMAAVHQSCGLPTKVWVMMGDAESEEGMTYEARNLFSTIGLKNLIVSLDYNHFGIDGPIEEVISSPYLNHWLGLGFNVIEVDGHSLEELTAAYRLARAGLSNDLPTAMIAHTIKGKNYGAKENTATSHGTLVSHEEYVEILHALGFAIPGVKGGALQDIEFIFQTLTEDDSRYVMNTMEQNAELIEPEATLLKKISLALKGRPLVDPLEIVRPKVLPPELTFASGKNVSTREAAGVWFEWLMKQSAFFYVGGGDVSKSLNLGGAEKVYGLINKENQLGRAFRFGIAEQNMAGVSTGLTHDVLPGGFHPISAFGTFAVFSVMMASAVRLALINNYLDPDRRGFFIMLASHDGPETGEDGPTHQGLYWQSLFSAYPGIKVYKPTDANETIEMLFYALEKGEPIVLSTERPAIPVLERGKGKSTAKEAVKGAYVFKDYANNGQERILLAVSGAIVLDNIFKIIPELERRGLDVKIVVATAPKLFAVWQKENPVAAEKVLTVEEKNYVVTIHNGDPKFLRDFVNGDYLEERMIGVDNYLKSGQADALYVLAGLDPVVLQNKILCLAKKLYL